MSEEPGKAPTDSREWLEADGLGGFASGTASGIRTRRYHAVLLAAARPPVERFVLVNGMDVRVSVGGRVVPVSVQQYGGGIRDPAGATALVSFEAAPWPRWRYDLGGNTFLEQELFCVHGSPITAMRWKLSAKRAGAELLVRPFLSGRDYHALHHENRAFRFDAEQQEGTVTWRPYEGVPGIRIRCDGHYVPEPLWYRGFSYAEEIARGFDGAEDLAAPGVFRLDLSSGSAACLLEATTPSEAALPAGSAAELWRTLATRERRRRRDLGSPLAAAADAYIARRGSGRTIVAGYPWFADWGRDTFIALRGLCLATGRLDVAERILVEWAGAVSGGMLPNRFPDRGEEPEFNSVDAALWYVVVTGEFLVAVDRSGRKLGREVSAKLRGAVQAILDGHAAGTRHGIALDGDGLLRAGVPGQQLTWMDARVGDRVITPRIGKPVEIQALWINALEVGAQDVPRWREASAQARASFLGKFLNEETGGLHDVVDVDHEVGRKDPTIRPNQILAVGGLPSPVVTGEPARRIVDLVEEHLLTRLGLRSLTPEDPRYAGRYEGGPAARDGVYHQGTVWPWLLGPFVEAWLRVHGTDPATLAAGRARFLEPLHRHLEEAGLGHVSEIADGDVPHVPRGCPFQAWSMGELLRVESLLRAAPHAEPKPPRDARHPSAAGIPRPLVSRPRRIE
jgi:predicted glycogen debranching enzyme